MNIDDAAPTPMTDPPTRPSEDEHVADNPQREDEDEHSCQGWLDRHIDAVVAQIATWPESLQPQLIGPRARAMEGFDCAPFGAGGSHYDH